MVSCTTKLVDINVIYQNTLKAMNELTETQGLDRMDLILRYLLLTEINR